MKTMGTWCCSHQQSTFMDAMRPTSSSAHKQNPLSSEQGKCDTGLSCLLKEHILQLKIPRINLLAVLKRLCLCLTPVPMRRTNNSLWTGRGHTHAGTHHKVSGFSTKHSSQCHVGQSDGGWISQRQARDCGAWRHTLMSVIRSKPAVTSSRCSVDGSAPAGPAAWSLCKTVRRALHAASPADCSSSGATRGSSRPGAPRLSLCGAAAGAAGKERAARSVVPAAGAPPPPPPPPLAREMAGVVEGASLSFVLSDKDNEEDGLDRLAACCCESLDASSPLSCAGPRGERSSPPRPRGRFAGGMPLKLALSLCGRAKFQTSGRIPFGL